MQTPLLVFCRPYTAEIRLLCIEASLYMNLELNSKLIHDFGGPFYIRFPSMSFNERWVT